VIPEHCGTRPAIDQSAYGVDRGTPPAVLMRRQSEFFGAHREDRECG